MENPKIKLYEKREFGEVFNVTFAFIKQEFKPLGRAVLVFILPLILIESIFAAFLQTSVVDMFKNTDILTQGVGLFFATFLHAYLPLMAIVIVLQTMIFSTITSYLKLYNLSDNEITIADLATEIKKNFFPLLVAILLGFIVILLGTVMCIIPGIYFCVILSIFPIALIIEQKGIGSAFSRSFQLVHIQWWWTFLLIFVTIIIIYIIAIIFQLPIMISGYATMFHNLRNNTNPMAAFGTGQIIYTSIVSAIQQILYLVPLLFMAFQYFNLVEIHEKPSLSEKINAIGENE